MASSLPFWLRCLAVLAVPTTAQQLQDRTDNSNNQWNIGNGFSLSWAADRLSITQDETSIWSTLSGQPFISASAGNDSVTGSNGAFNITEIDENRCQDQTISSINSVPWDDSLTGSAAQISGSLLNCGDASAGFTLTFWTPHDLPDRVHFYLNVDQSNNPQQPLKKLYLSFASHEDEDFYGFGGQASFASLKGQSVPIFTREQGVGRGDQPVTDIENANGSFAGGDQFTTYTAIPSYITTDGNVFYLSEKSTGYANFDLRDPGAVTVRYDSLSVDGAFMRGGDMFEAVEKLTAYTGRQPHLPEWADHGAVLGIQGGEEKVNRIVEQGIEIDCPIAGGKLLSGVA